jgi:hypothetical protein
LSAKEVVIMQEAGVKKHDSASPPSIGLKAGAFADLGTLILTNCRIIYIEKGSAERSIAWVFGGAIAGSAFEKSVSQADMDQFMQYPGSFFIPLQNVTNVKAARKMGGAYLSVSNNSPGLKPAYSFVFGGGWTRHDEWVNAVNSAKGGAGPIQAAQAENAASTQLPPPPPDFTPPTCPQCAGPLTYIQQYQRWYCYKDQKYV